MDPHKFSVLDLFLQPERYVIPLYQRRYIWTKDKQWQPLWNDIQAKVQEFIAKEATKEAVHPHFLGAIVVSKQFTTGNSLNIYDVVDGQQRLTTFQVFLLAFRDQLRFQSEYKLLYGRLRGLTRNGNPDMEVEPDEQYKVWPTRFDQPIFKEIWGHPDPDQLLLKIQEGQEEHQAIGNLKAAYAYFSHQLRPWLAEDPNHADALFTTLKQHLQVVRIDLMPNDDAQVIFETLNARGEPLQAADLIRNFIFQQVDHQKLNVQTYFETYWKDFDEDGSPWRDVVARGRIRRDQLTWFLAYFLTVQQGREIPEGRIFEEFKAWWMSPAQAAQSLSKRLETLKQYAQAYHRLITTAADSRLGLLIHRLEALDTTTLTPILLYLLTHPELPPKEFEGILLHLESYLMRRFVCGLTNKNNNQRFLTLLARLKGERTTRQTASGPPELTAAYVRAFLSEGEGDSVRWPEDAEVLTHLTQDPVYRTLKPRGVVMVLEAAELTRHTDKQEKLLFAGKSTVEHVLPRRWETHWTAPAAMDGFDEPALINRRNHLLHTLGNLTLLTHKLNASLSNSKFEIKKPAITEQTLRLLNADFQKPVHWDEIQIEHRSAHLAQSLLKVWGAPLQMQPRGRVMTPAPEESGLDAIRLFDDWLNGRQPQYFKVEAFEKDDQQGVQFVPRHWSKSWKVRVYAHEQAGQDRLTLEIRSDFGQAEPYYVLGKRVLASLLEPLRLSFGDQLDERGPETCLTLQLNPESTPVELQAVVNRVMALLVPRLARALGQAEYRSGLRALDDLALSLWPSLPEGVTFLPEDLDNKPHRRLLKIGWAAPPELHYALKYGADGCLIISLNDEVAATHPMKSGLKAIWPALQQAAQDTLPWPVQLRSMPKTQALSIELPEGADLDTIQHTLLTFITATQSPLMAWMKEGLA